uniref:Signal peptidase complex subunit 1 n=1 Tax=Gongylonema pulchrum TaxID=637853 RepID=A0A183EV09_9BILA
LQGRIMKFDEVSRQMHAVPWIPASNVIPWQPIRTRSKRHRSAKRSANCNSASSKKFQTPNIRSKSAQR